MPDPVELNLCVRLQGVLPAIWPVDVHHRQLDAQFLQLMVEEGVGAAIQLSLQVMTIALFWCTDPLYRQMWLENA